MAAPPKRPRPAPPPPVNHRTANVNRHGAPVAAPPAAPAPTLAHRLGSALAARRNRPKPKRYSRWSTAVAQHRATMASMGHPAAASPRGRSAPSRARQAAARPRPRPRPRRRVPVRRGTASSVFTALVGALVVTAAAMELLSVAMAAELGIAAEGLGLATLWLTCEPAPPKAPRPPGKGKPKASGTGPGGYVKGGTCGSTATKDKTPCGNPVAHGQSACYLHGGANPNGTGSSTPAKAAGSTSSTSQAPPAKRRRKPTKGKPPAPSAPGSMPTKAP